MPRIGVGYFSSLLGDAIKATGLAKSLTKQVIGFIESGLPSRVLERDKQQTIVARYSGWLVGMDPAALDLLSSADRQVSPDDLRSIANEKRLVAEASLAEAKNTYANFSMLKDQSLNLAQQLREIAAKLIQINERPDECPLCHSKFQKGELEKHINVGVDDHLEVLAQTILTQLRQKEDALKDARSIEAVASWLTKFCKRASLGVDVGIDTLLAEVENTKRMLVEAQAQLDLLGNEVLSLESIGFSMAELTEISAQLHELGFPLTSYSLEVVNEALSSIDLILTSTTKKLEELQAEAKELLQSLRVNFGSPESERRDLSAALSRLKERIATTERLREKLNQFSLYYPWPEDRPLSEFLVEAESVRKVATELEAALSREKLAEATQVESLKRKKQIEQQLSDVIPRADRLAKAHSTLKGLQTEHSLKMAMEAALQENRVGIETIFSQIHSPAEFSGLGKSWTTLIRKNDNREAKLTQISTGQRAAFALSIFLAQNAQLESAPPVILIDDPIAHVDDMNSLAFLDYLREVVLLGQRQIFFATANAKLATLFERKFDFLGDQFCKFNLSRQHD